MKALFASLLALFLWLPLTAHAEITALDRKAMDDQFATFMKNVNDGKIAEAYQGIFLEAVTEDPSNLDPLIEATKNVVTYFDNSPIKYSLAREVEFSPVVVRRVYVLYTDKMPTTIKITFFKTSHGWLAQFMRIEDIADTDFKD